ncbi:thermonuclease family protein [Sphingomonas sp. BT-65]|uniref:thermonuclease family protein n=1 Tax=Sphingomonas sp. BT-65 TaxID=2989821 RepID=UPI0022354891|nr:thermonuclease family protein [Sphingomonas sp. BT-65]MCW4463023.1 thermonuclease family protein [Sphingomonas sp. BT-65]
MKPGRWMRQLAVLALLFLVLAVIAELRGPPERLTADGARTHVIDGDSLQIGARTVRLQGIDAVEFHQPCTTREGKPWTCGIEARKALAALAGRGGLVCETHATDNFGRAVSTCSVAGVADIAAALVAQGWAVSGDGEREGLYLAEQEAARAAGRGIWRGSFTRPAEWRAAHPRSAPSVPAA